MNWQETVLWSTTVRTLDPAPPSPPSEKNTYTHHHQLHAVRTPWLCLKPDRRAPRTFLPASSLVSETQTVGQRLARLDRLSSTTTD